MYINVDDMVQSIDLAVSRPKTELNYSPGVGLGTMIVIYCGISLTNGTAEQRPLPANCVKYKLVQIIVQTVEHTCKKSEK